MYPKLAVFRDLGCMFRVRENAVYGDHLPENASFSPKVAFCGGNRCEAAFKSAAEIGGSLYGVCDSGWVGLRRGEEIRSVKFF